jgi:menaquinone-dependent protoporphyrinogen oxidase
MADILVVYGTTEGHTAKIAARIAETARTHGHRVVIQNAAALPSNFQVDRFDGVIIGGSVHRGMHQAALRAFVERYLPVLRGNPTAFFSVSLSAADPETVADATDMAIAFLEETGWQPTHLAVFAGALVYTQYDSFTRLLMKLIVRRAGRPDTDTMRDYVYTDWSTVEAFTERFVGSLMARAVLTA